MISLTNIDINKFVNTKELPEPASKNCQLKIGEGGGQHIILFQGYLSCDDFPKYLVKLTKFMLCLFEKEFPNVQIINIYTEHRLYIFDDKPFIGTIHHDRAQYTVLCYLDIGTDIVGGELAFYNGKCGVDEFDNHDVHVHNHVMMHGTFAGSIKPKIGDIVIFNGLHSITKTYASGKSNRRAIWALFINDTH